MLLFWHENLREFELHRRQNRSRTFLQKCAVGDFYGTGIEIWAGKLFCSIRDTSPRDFSIMTLFVERHESHSRHALNENFIGNVSQIFSAFVLISASSNIGFSPLHTKKEPS